MKKPLFLGIHADPSQKRWFAVLCNLWPFIFCLVLYMYFAYSRHQINPDDRLFPYFSQMYESMKNLAFTKDQYSEQYTFWVDTYDSLVRLVSGVSISVVIGLIWGLYMGVYPGLRQMFGTFTIVLSVIVIPIFQPIISYVVGFEDVGKVSLIALGTVFFIARDMLLNAENIRKAYAVKAATLGLSDAGIVHRMVIPLLLPKWINAIRFSLGAAWIFLIMAEFSTSETGLGHQVAINKRQMNMDIIIPYGIWTAYLAYLMDYGLKLIYEKIKHEE